MKFVPKHHLDLVTLLDGACVWRRFTAEVDDDGLVLDIEVDDVGVPTCVGISSAAGLTTESLRIPLDSLVRQAASEAATFFRVGPLDVQAPFPVVSPDTPHVRPAKMHERAVKATRRPRRLTAELLREVAQLYNQQTAAGLSPIAAIEGRWDVGRSTAHRWASEARARGLIEASSQSSSQSARFSRPRTRKAPT